MAHPPIGNEQKAATALSKVQATYNQIELHTRCDAIELARSNTAVTFASLPTRFSIVRLSP